MEFGLHAAYHSLHGDWGLVLGRSRSAIVTSSAPVLNLKESACDDICQNAMYDGSE